MRAIIVRCPQCGANLKIEHTVTSVKCSYCDTVSRIQARTAVLQVPKPLRGPAPNRAPVATQTFSWWRMLPFLLVIVAIAAGVFFAKSAHQAMADQMHWVGRAPTLIDVDGDGVRDAVGTVFYPMSNSRAHYLAVSGKTGATLWESDSLGSYSDLGQSVMGATAELILIASDRGVLEARDKTGKVRWTLPFSEKIEEMCEAPKGEIALMTADKKWFLVDAQGKRREGSALLRFDHEYTNDSVRERFLAVGAEAQPDICMPISDASFRRTPGTLTLPRWKELVPIEGMSVDRYIRKPGGPIVAFGYKTPGTAVKMFARADGAWKIEIPAVDPLVSRVDEKHVALSDKHVIALYEPKSPAKPRLTAFDLASGKRLWDVEVQPGQHSFNAGAIAITGDVVLLSTYQGLRGHALADGSERFSVGYR